jgi:stearoyl-CoA 9-desaturase NADPH oxidoreductase
VPLLETLPRAARTGVTGLARAIATPLVPSDYLDLVDPVRSATLRARVVDVRPETRDAATLVLQPGRRWAGHVPGQWVRIGVDVDGVRHWRAYSLTNPPRRDGLLTITVKAIADGRVSHHLVRRARPGTVVHLDQAAGEFVLPDPRPAKTLFVSAGSGITPVMGMLRGALAELDDVVVVHSAPTRDDVVFGSELRALARAGRLRLVERHTDADGMLTTAELAQLVPDWASRETWACGPVGMLDALAEHWAAAGCEARLHTERFRPTVIATGDGGTIGFERTGTTVDADAATPLLDAGEDAGVLLPSGCRMGICFGCIVPLRAGAVRDLRTGELTAVDGDEPVMVQTCISAAAGDCRLDA